MGVTLAPYVSHFDVERPYMAHVMGICAGLVGPKSENVEDRTRVGGELEKDWRRVCR